MGKYTELVTNQRELHNKLSMLERELDNYPKAGDLIKHKMDHTFNNPRGFVKLTPEKWIAIEKSGDWSHYEVLRKIL